MTDETLHLHRPSQERLDRGNVRRLQNYLRPIAKLWSEMVSCVDHLTQR